MVIKALGDMGGGVEIAPLSQFVLAYHADPTFSSQIAPVSAAIDILLGQGSTPERALVAFVADDPRTQASIAEYARRALEQSARPAPARETPATSASKAAASAPAAGGQGSAQKPAGQPEKSR